MAPTKEPSPTSNVPSYRPSSTVDDLTLPLIKADHRTSGYYAFKALQ